MYYYEETLKIVEEFMHKTGIRDYCAEICKGGCCGACTDRACLTGNRRLACSIFICQTLGNILNQLDERGRKTHDTVSKHIESVLQKGARRNTLPNSSVFFRQYPSNITDNASFDKEVIDKLNEIDYWKWNRLIASISILCIRVKGGNF